VEPSSEELSSGELGPSLPGPPEDPPKTAADGASGALGYSGNGSVMHGDTHFLES
jgi:hypothetical protein